MLRRVAPRTKNISDVPGETPARASAAALMNCFEQAGFLRNGNCLYFSTSQYINTGATIRVNTALVTEWIFETSRLESYILAWTSLIYQIPVTGKKKTRNPH